MYPWEQHKSIIYELYIVRRWPLDKVMEELEDKHHFTPEERAFKSKLKEWGFSKNDSHKRRDSEKETPVASSTRKPSKKHSSKSAVATKKPLAVNPTSYNVPSTSYHYPSELVAYPASAFANNPYQTYYDPNTYNSGIMDGQQDQQYQYLYCPYCVSVNGWCGRESCISQRR